MSKFFADIDTQGGHICIGILLVLVGVVIIKLGIATLGEYIAMQSFGVILYAMKGNNGSKMTLTPKADPASTVNATTTTTTSTEAAPAV